MAQGFDQLVSALQVRFDFQSARIMVREALSRAGLKEQPSYSPEELQKFVDGLNAVSTNLSRVWTNLGISPSGVPLPPPPAPPAPPKKAEPPPAPKKVEVAPPEPPPAPEPVVEAAPVVEAPVVEAAPVYDVPVDFAAPEAPPAELPVEAAPVEAGSEAPAEDAGWGFGGGKKKDKKKKRFEEQSDAPAEGGDQPIES